MPCTYCILQVSEFAAAKRVVLKGDLPIGVDKRSVDTWMEVRQQAARGACSGAWWAWWWSTSERSRSVRA